VVHTQGVADLVDHVSPVAHGTAPTQVDPARRRRPPQGGIAAARVVDADLDVRKLEAACLNDGNARVSAPVLRRGPEGLLPHIVHLLLRIESIADDHVIVPHVRHARWRRRLPLIPRPRGKAPRGAVAGPLVARRPDLQQASPSRRRGGRTFAVLLGLGLDRPTCHDGVHVGLLDQVGREQLHGHTAGHEGAREAVDAQGARGAGCQRAPRQREPRGWPGAPPHLRVQGRGPAPTLPLQREAEEVEAPGEAEVEARRGRERVRAHAEEGQAAAAGRVAVPPDAGGVQGAGRVGRPAAAPGVSEAAYALERDVGELCPARQTTARRRPGPSVARNLGAHATRARLELARPSLARARVVVQQLAARGVALDRAVPEREAVALRNTVAERAGHPC